MSDNVPITAGSGTVIAADEVIDPTLGTVKVQFMKLMDGTLDSTNKLTIDSSGRAAVAAALAPSAAIADRSSTIATGGSAQQLLAANAARTGYLIQNNSVGTLWLDITTAVQAPPSIKLISGAYFESPRGMQGTGAISIIGSTTGQAFTCKEW
jgi:hypothetical protein